MMILKRLLVTALGAMGLGVLAAGPATAQQIPAPDAYGDSLACQNGIPVIKAKAMKDHPLDSGIEDGGLSNAQIASLTAMARACADDPVGDGIAKARELHQTYVRAEETRDIAQKAYDDNPTTLNKGDLDDAKDAYDEAKKARDDYAGMGEVYKAVFDEEARRTAATDAHTQWDKDYKAEQAAATAKNGVQYANYLEQFAGFDSNGQALEFVNTRLQTTWDNPATTDVDETAYTTYVQVRDQFGDIIAPTKQQDGTYVVPTRLGSVSASNPDGSDGASVGFEVLEYDHDNDSDTPVQQLLRVDNNTVSSVRTDNQTFGATGGIDADTKAAKEALEKAGKDLKANKDGTRTVALTEAKRKAQARYDFFKTQSDAAYGDLRRGKLSNPTGDDPLTPDVDESTTSTTGFKYTVRHYEAFSRAESTEAAAAKALKDAYDGQALVDAVSSTYDTAKSAKDTADGVASDVAGLTGEGGAVAMNTAAIEKNAGNIASNMSAIGANTSAIADNANAIGSNSAAIQRNSGMIGELSESLETVRAGVAASMALAGMPAINGRGISIGVGSFDGESAFAVGFMIQGEMASFKVGVTSAGGATGASAGVGFQF